MPNQTTVLVVEDNPDMLGAVVTFLEDNGYRVLAAQSAEKAIVDDLASRSDVAVIDIALPGMTGLRLTEILKQQGFEGPIIAITARDTIDDKLTGLATGMDDYLVKPFDLRELVARINAQLRTKGDYHDQAPVQTAHFRIEPKQHRFYAHGAPVKLTHVEFRLMQCLMQRNHTTVDTLDLIEAGWGEDASTSNPPIRIHISNLRAKIGDTNLTIIHTVPGIGYMLSDEA